MEDVIIVAGARKHESSVYPLGSVRNTNCGSSRLVPNTHIHRGPVPLQHKYTSSAVCGPSSLTNKSQWRNNLRGRIFGSSSLSPNLVLRNLCTHLKRFRDWTQAPDVIRRLSCYSPLSELRLFLHLQTLFSLGSLF